MADNAVKTPVKRRKAVECPYCHKVVRNVPNHISAKHPAENKERKEAAPPLDVAVLTGQKKPSEIAPTLHPEDRIYYCADCHAELRKGEDKCWKCEAILNWEGIK